jgi:hypothetical protein
VQIIDENEVFSDFAVACLRAIDLYSSAKKMVLQIVKKMKMFFSGPVFNV